MAFYFYFEKSNKMISLRAEIILTMEKTTRKIIVVLITFLMIISCGEGAKSGLGESCTKTADCKDGLKCILMVCDYVLDDTDNKNDSDVN